MVEERLIKMGERDDTLPPEYRLTEEDRKVADIFISHRCDSIQSSPLGLICLMFKFGFKENGRGEEKSSPTNEGKNAVKQPQQRTLSTTG